MGRGEVVIEPTIAEIDAELCSGCRVCNNLCAYAAISFDPVREVSEINPGAVQGLRHLRRCLPFGAAQAEALQRSSRSLRRSRGFWRGMM